MPTSIKIIDNKKLALTPSEWDMYQSICRSYDRPYFKGEELFKDLFQSDNDGIIIFLKPPSSRYTSMEVFLFISGLMVHQHVRQMHAATAALHKSLTDQMNEKNKLIDEKLLELSTKK